MLHIRAHKNMFGNAVRRIITIKAFAAFGWMRLSRNMGRMILIFTATTKVLLYSAAISILSCTPKVFMMDYGSRGRKMC